MSVSHVYPLRLFPRRLARSLFAFAAAGSLMAGVVLADGAAGRALPLAMMAASWAIPLALAWRIWRHGHDPLASLTLDDEGLIATYRDGSRRLLPWGTIDRLLAIEGARFRAWQVGTRVGEPLRWFGELEEPEALAKALAGRTGLAWETVSAVPD